MLTVSKFSPTNVAQTHNNIQSYKYSQPIKDTFELSFKGIDDFDETYEMKNPLLDFIEKINAKAKAKQIFKNSQNIKKESILEYRRAKSIVDGEEKWIRGGRLRKQDIIGTGSGKSLYKSYFQGQLRRVTHFSRQGKDVSIEQVDIHNPDGTKDIIITNDKNDVRLIRKGVKQIAPQSYLEDKIYAFTKGGILKFYYDNASKVNDGVASSKSETKHNLHRFDNGQLSYYVPLATYVGKELHYDKKYIYQDGKIRTYMVDVDVIRGEDEPKKRFDFIV